SARGAGRVSAAVRRVPRGAGAGLPRALHRFRDHGDRSASRRRARQLPGGADEEELMSALTFLNPYFLWGLTLGSIPIIIHLLQRRRFRVRHWAAMEFLRLSVRNTSRRLRIEQLLLLAIRVLILVLAAAALARPVVNTAAVPLLAGNARVHAVI